MDDQPRGNGPGMAPDPDGHAARMPASDGYVGLTQRNAWHTAAVMFGLIPIAVVAQALLGIFGDAITDETTLYASCASCAALSIVFWRFSHHELRPWVLQVAPVTGYLALAATMHSVPTLEPHLGLAYLTPLIFAALFMNARSLGFYICLSIAFITYATLRHASEDYGVIPGVMAIAALVTTASLTMYVRLQLDDIGRQAAFLSGRDALTGLANLRPLYERVETLTRRADRGYGGLTVVMLDLDGFKRVNDQHSHSTGDETLRLVANALQSVARRDELVARRGGDEFAIVTETVDPAEIEALIERIRERVMHVRSAMLPDVPPGITAGYAIFREGDTVGQLLARADRHLHQAKAASRVKRWSWRDEEEE